MSQGIVVRPMEPQDWPAVETIYRQGIATGNATFEAGVPTWEEFDTGKLRVGRLVAADGLDGAVSGWVAISPVSSRPVYAGVVEHSVYVADSAKGRGIGRALVAGLLTSADEAGIWTVQSSIFPENTSSLALHERAGFRVVGRRERIARMTYGPWSGLWRDTILIERRSAAE